MPNNLYGPNDNFNLETSHVIPALLKKMHEAKINNNEIVQIWGSGTPLREFLYVKDLAEAVVFCLLNVNSKFLNSLGVSHLNVGSGFEVSIAALVSLIKRTVGYKGNIIYDTTKLDGVPRKFLDSTLIKKLGWKPKTDLKSGLKKLYSWYKKNNIQN